MGHCVMFPFIILASFIAIITSTLASFPFIEPKRNLLMIITVAGLFTASVLEIVTGWLYRSDLVKQQQKLDEFVDKPFGDDGFLNNIGNKILGGDNFLNDFMQTVHELGSGALEAGNASIYMVIVGCLNTTVFGYGLFILISERNKRNKFSKGMMMN